MAKGGRGRRVPAESDATLVGREILALALIAAGLFLTVSALSFRLNDPLQPILDGARVNWGGSIGHSLGGYFVESFGLACYPLFAFFLYWGLLLFLDRPLPRPAVRVFGAFALVLTFAVFLAGPTLSDATPRTPLGFGGGLGHYLAPRLHYSFGGFGVWLLLVLSGCVAFLVATDWPLRAIVEDLRALKPERGKARKGRKRAAKNAESGPGPILRGFGFAFAKTKATIQDLFGPAEETAVAAPSKRRRKTDVVEEEVEYEEDDPEDADAEYEDEVEYEEGDEEYEDEEYEDEGEYEDDDSEEEPDEEEEVVEEPVLSRRERRRQRRESRAREAAAADESEPSPETAGTEEVVPPRREASPAAKAAAARVAAEKRAAKAGGTQQLLPINIVGIPSRSAKSRRESIGDYRFPPLDLLEPTLDDQVTDKDELRKHAEAIERRLGSHNVEAKVVRVSAGPAVTVYELELAEGTRVTSIPKFAPDLAAALKAFSVRVVAPIPGKHTIGIEVPNERRSLVRMRELCELREPGKTPETVPLFLGRDVAGQPLIADLARMPHLLIAGATGSGKSVCINSILLSVLLTKSPDDIRLILIDPKMVELQNYAKIPHLLCPVVTSMKRVQGVLEWSVETMEQRYALLSKAGVRNLKDYNALGEEKLRERLGKAFDPEHTPIRMPTIVMIIDEFADLMAVAANEVEVSIQRLAQKSRAVGIHVILATQRPSRDVITGLIKANLPTRLAFQVSSRIDSRVVLDANGAEQLLGHGDMLYIPPGTNRLVRAQGTYIADEEIHAITEFLEESGQEQVFETALAQVPTGSNRKAKERDDLYEDAVRAVLEEQRGSATLIQRKLSVGYTRASRLIEIMAEDGIVGEFVGSKSREVMMTLDEWEAIQVATAEALDDAENRAAEDGATDEELAFTEDAPTDPTPVDIELDATPASQAKPAVTDAQGESDEVAAAGDVVEDAEEDEDTDEDVEVEYFEADEEEDGDEDADDEEDVDEEEGDEDVEGDAEEYEEGEEEDGDEEEGEEGEDEGEEEVDEEDDDEEEDDEAEDDDEDDEEETDEDEDEDEEGKAS